MNILETNCAIQWIEIYPVDSAIHLLNNWDLEVKLGQYFVHYLFYEMFW